MERALLTSLNAARAARRAALLVTDLERGAERVLVDGAIPPGDPLEVHAHARFLSGASGLVETAAGPRFLTVCLPPPRLVLVGAVHIAQALAPMARLAGLDVHVIDPRQAFATAERFGAIPVSAAWPQDVLPELGLDRFTGLAALTHDPKIDDPALVAALAAGCFYVGALGSRRTHAARLARLGGQVAAEALGRIEAPIGLDLGGRSPPEIAVAVLASVVRALRQGSAA